MVTATYKVPILLSVVTPEVAVVLVILEVVALVNVGGAKAIVLNDEPPKTLLSPFALLCT